MGRPLAWPAPRWGRLTYFSQAEAQARTCEAALGLSLSRILLPRICCSSSPLLFPSPPCASISSSLLPVAGTPSLLEPNHFSSQDHA